MEISEIREVKTKIKQCLLPLSLNVHHYLENVYYLQHEQQSLQFPIPIAYMIEIIDEMSIHTTHR